MARFPYQKTPEEIEQEQQLLAEQYPEEAPASADPTQPMRDAAIAGLQSFIPEKSALGQSMAQPERAPAQYEMPEDLKNHAFDLFPSLKELNEKAYGQKIPQVPFRPEALEESQPEVQPQQTPAASSSLQQSPVSVVEQAELQSEQEAPTEPTEQQAPQQQDDQYDQMLNAIDEAEQSKKDTEFSKASAEFRNAILGVGLGRKIDLDTSTYKDKLKAADRPLKNLLAKKEIQQAKEKDDPNSNISKLLRKSLTDLGMNMDGLDKISYSQLEKLYPSLTQALYTKLAAEARRQEAAANRETRAVDKEDRQTVKDAQLKEHKFNEVNRRAQNFLKADELKLYNNTKVTDGLINQAVTNWDSADKSYKEPAQAAFMGYAKAAQQDSSVVRESDLKVLGGGINYGNLGQLVDKYATRLQGADFTKKELQEFKAVMKTIRDIKRKELRSRISPIINTSNNAGIPLDTVFDPAFVEDVMQPTQEDKIRRYEELKKKQQG